MTFEERCIAHYVRVETRVGKYPPKPPIVMPASIAKARKPRATKYQYDSAVIKRLWLKRITVSEIARRCGVSRKGMDKFIKRQGWQR